MNATRDTLAALAQFDLAARNAVSPARSHWKLPPRERCLVHRHWRLNDR